MTQHKSQQDEILYGWKQIADCLGCCPRTAQRLEAKENLPVLRPDKRQKGRVLALRRSIVAWMTGDIENVSLTENRLLAFNRKTRLLWSHEFASPLRSYSAEELEWRLRIVDLDDTGERGVLFAARHLSAGIPDAIYFFNAQGEIAWKWEALPQLANREGMPFERAWVIKHMVIGTSSGRPTVWAALGNDAGWAGCVIRIDQNGSARVHFANAGFVEWLCPVVLDAGSFLIACGENNDYDDSFVALLGSDDPPACSVPGNRLVYRFADALRAQPRKCILFPKSETMTALLRPYGHATRIVEHLDGIIVIVETGEGGAHYRYHFSKYLEPRYVFPSGNHEFIHRSLEKSGAISHAWIYCPELQAPLLLRTWEPDSGWYDQPIPWRDNPWKEIKYSVP